MNRTTLLLSAAVMLAGGPAAFAQGLHVSQHLAGYQCMSLNLSEQQLLTNSAPVPVRSGPSPTSPQVGVAGSTVAVAAPLQPVNGFYKMLFPNGATVWIEAAKLRPWANSSNPKATCTPSMMSNGKPGFDYR